MRTTFQSKILKEKHYLGEIGVDDNVIVRWILIP